MKIELCEIDSIYPSAYNPRESDPERLKLIELSLRKFGFLLPGYANKNGELVSGHQRHLVANRMGVKLFPIIRIKDMPLNKLKALNIVFNRGTNDFKMLDDTKKIIDELQNISLDDLNMLPDIDINSEEFYPCLKTQMFSTIEIIKANKGKYNPYARNIARTLYTAGIIMPILMKPNLEIINGLGRLHLLAEKGFKQVEGLIIPFEKADFAELLLNKISMDFSLHNKYRDVLRYNSFRRSISNRPGLGRGFYIALFGDITTKEFDLTGSNLERWIGYYGSKVLDFGAGHLTDTMLLKKAGIEVTPFEPYKIKSGSNEIDKSESINLTNQFLRKVEMGYKWHSIFISSVLNSVPFYEDRKMIIQILAALSFGSKAKVFGWTMSVKNKEWESPEREYLSSTSVKTLKFRLHYEDGIMLGNFNSKPKVQKYHTIEEAIKLFKTSFENVTVRHIKDSISIIAEEPKINVKELRKAIEFEFNLPYPDGTTMGMVNEAKQSFAKRLNLPELLK